MKTVKILFSDKRMTMFAQHADVFEKFKVIVHPIILAKVVDDFGPAHIQKIEEKCEKDNYGLVAIYDLDKVYYRNPDVRVISDGRHWQMLDEILPSLTLNVTVGEEDDRRIT